jgi:NAD(P)-dependent dehydrogenase (short-subunit alcohol dehydrogenase family)
MSYSGKYCIVTGGNNGIGLEIVRGLAKQGAFIVIACRSVEKGNKAAYDIMQECQHECKIIVLKLDLSSFTSIRKFAQNYIQLCYPLHFLFNNAGILSSSSRDEITKDGFDLVWQTNYLGHFLLTSLLFDKLKESAPSRIINVSSCMHEYAPRNVNFYEAAKNTFALRYPISKLAQILFSYEFQRKFANDTKVQSIVIHPGGVNTNIWDRFCLGKIVKSISPFVLLTSEQAALVPLSAGLISFDHIGSELKYYAPFKQWISGVQLSNDLISLCFCLKPGAHEIQSSKLSHDAQLAIELWKLSEEAIGSTFN